MLDFYVCYRDCLAFVVSSAVIDIVALAFPGANIIQSDNMNNRVVRYDP